MLFDERMSFAVLAVWLPQHHPASGRQLKVCTLLCDSNMQGCAREAIHEAVHGYLIITEGGCT